MKLCTTFMIAMNIVVDGYMVHAPIIYYYEVVGSLNANTVLVMFLRGINIDHFKTLHGIATCILHTPSLSCANGYNTYYKHCTMVVGSNHAQTNHGSKLVLTYIVLSQALHVTVYSSWTAPELIRVIRTQIANMQG